MGNCWSRPQRRRDSYYYQRQSSRSSESHTCTNKQRTSFHKSSPGIINTTQKEAASIYSSTDHSENSKETQEEALAQKSPLSSPAQKEDISTPSQTKHSESATNKERTLTHETSPPACSVKKENSSILNQTDDSNTVSVSQEPDAMKVKQNNHGELTNTEQLQATISNAGKSTASNIISKTGQDVSCNETEVFCSKPSKPIAIDITRKAIEIEWTKPEQGAQNDISYSVLYRSANDPDDLWKVIAKTAEERTIVTVSKLTEGTRYYFKIQSNGSWSESDSSKPITMLSPTLRNVLNKITRAETKWYYIGLYFEPKEGDLKLDTIEKDNHNYTQDCLRKVIQSWLNQTGGSWKKLIEALQQETVGFHELAESIADNIGLSISCCNYGETAPSDKDEFKDHLKLLYRGLTATKSSANTWPPSVTRKVFNLAMIKSTEVRRGQIQDEFIRQTITGKIDDILREKFPVKLKDILQEEEQEENEKEVGQKVVLLEGAPGCGKSTLSVHISQQWGEGKLFTEFKYAILVQLRDPVVQAASSIADVLPAKNDKMRMKAAEDITANYGERVLFILDGWDELSSKLRMNSIFCEMIQPGSLQNNPLLKSTIIITSRPIASSDLHQCASSRIEVLGFTPEELENYFTECLKGDSKAVELLLERIHENPAIAGSCYLPMNASILVHLFINDNNTLPTTEYGIFSELVLSCMYRHHNQHTQLKNLTLESLHQIPEAIKEPFLCLCDLAYQGIMDDKVIFSSLPADINTLGLLQGVESFVRRGKAVSYNFLHLSIQEVLAGFYIATQLSHDEQVSIFNKMFDKSRFSAVFQFYAAITKLQTPGIKDVIIRITKLQTRGIKDVIIRVAIRGSKTAALLSLLHCLYEAQDFSLCEFVAQQLQDQYELDLRHITLTSSDCLCIGHLLSHVCKMATGKFKVNLCNCNIDARGCKYLVSGLCKNLGTHRVGTTPDINLDHNTINNGNGLTLPSTERLEEVFTTNKHSELDISGNPLYDDGIQHLARALQINQHLKYLCLGDCGITDAGIEYLIKSLQDNTGLNTLHLINTHWSSCRNKISVITDFSFILTKYLPKCHTLTSLRVSKDLGLTEYETTEVQRAVNDVRMRNGFPYLEVSSVCTIAD